MVKELQRLGMDFVSFAPRWVGQFEKGVEFIGDLDALQRDFQTHAEIARALGPYKLSLHSGSDKYSTYPADRRGDQGRGAPQDGRHQLGGGAAGDRRATTPT